MKEFAVTALCTIVLAFALWTIDNRHTVAIQKEAMKFERATTIAEVNSCLRAQGYKIRFRETQFGMSMIFPGSKREIISDRLYDKKLEKTYAKGE